MPVLTLDWPPFNPIDALREDAADAENARGLERWATLLMLVHCACAVDQEGMAGLCEKLRARALVAVHRL